MFEQIEDPLFSEPCKIIKNWDQIKCAFRYFAATLRAHEISKMMAQIKKRYLL